jgi:hypothetical protein
MGFTWSIVQFGGLINEIYSLILDQNKDSHENVS